jgi:hypothetical protein
MHLAAIYDIACTLNLLALIYLYPLSSAVRSTPDMISNEDALSLLRKWHEESSRIRCMYVRPGLQLMFVGTIDRIAHGEAFGMRTQDKESSVIFPFSDVTFLEYGDSRIAPDDPNLQSVAREYEGFLVVKMSDGTSFTLGEIKQ